MNADWLVERSHLSLIVQNSVQQTERELLITVLHEAFIEYCFWERHTPNCFMCAKWETSEAEEETVAENEL